MHMRRNVTGGIGADDRHGSVELATIAARGRGKGHAWQVEVNRDIAFV